MSIYLSLVGATYATLKNVIIYNRSVNPLEFLPTCY